MISSNVWVPSSKLGILLTSISAATDATCSSLYLAPDIVALSRFKVTSLISKESSNKSLLTILYESGLLTDSFK